MLWMELNTKPPSRREHLATLQHLPAHLLGRTEGQRLLGIDTPAPEYQRSRHTRSSAGCGSMPDAEHCTGLRMSKPAFDERRDKLLHRAARVFERLPAGVAVDPVVDLACSRAARVRERWRRNRTPRSACRSPCRRRRPRRRRRRPPRRDTRARLSKAISHLPFEDLVNVVRRERVETYHSVTSRMPLGYLRNGAGTSAMSPRCGAAEGGDHAPRPAAARSPMRR